MPVYLWGVIILAALVGVYFLLRWQYSRQIHHSDICPKCGGTEFHRVHRSTTDRVLGIGLDTRRYRCANPGCKWEGMRPYYRRPKEWTKSED